MITRHHKWGLILTEQNNIKQPSVKQGSVNKGSVKQWFSNTSIFLQGEVTLESNTPLSLQWLSMLHQQQVIQSMDYHFVSFIFSEFTSDNANNSQDCLSDDDLSVLLLLVAKLSFDMSLQDACLRLDKLDIKHLFGYLPSEIRHHPLTIALMQQLTQYSRYQQWQDILLSSNLVELYQGHSNVNTSEEKKPLILFEQCLYMRRYFNYERQIVDFIAGTSQTSPNAFGHDKSWYKGLTEAQIDKTVSPLFPPQSSDSIDWQKQAVINSITKPFSVICGGPGTGKTTTVVKLLAALIELHQAQLASGEDRVSSNLSSNSSLKIQLAAPTGKAAQRLAESIGHSLNYLELTAQTKQQIPNSALTIHRLLKPRGLTEFTYNQNNKLFLDVLIIDEASMVDLSLMSKLLGAVPAHAQVILLGDKQQLSSVETGNVLAEICTDITDALNLVVELKKSYRFNASGLIGLLAQSINAGDVHQTLNLLNQQANTTNLNQPVNWLSSDVDNLAVLIDFSFKHQLTLFDLAAKFSTLDESHTLQLLNQLFTHLQQFQLLTCIKEGDRGVEGINQQIKSRLATRKLIHYQQHYHCRPIMITENAYHLGLYNGDIGLQLFDEHTQQLMTYFLQNDGELMIVSCQRLPKHETMYAMTVHKSQGSEFAHVALVLPETNKTNKILSREILYTGLTRAKQQFTLFGDTKGVEQAVHNVTSRQSGLSLLLQKKLQSTA